MEIELPKKEERDNPLLIPVSVTISVLAVFIAGVTLLGHRQATDRVLLNSEAFNQWSYYQAKNGRLNMTEGFAYMVEKIPPADQKTAAEMHEHYAKAIAKYEADKEEIAAEAKKLEAERDKAARRENHFHAGEGLLEIGLIICSMTLLTDRKLFWYSGMIVGAIGVLVASGAFFLVH
jgi:hypothetical protein